MNEQLELVREFHEKFHVPVLQEPTLIPADRSVFRHRLMKEEVEEYLKGVEKKDVENIAKELCDVLYAVYGTILEHGLQDKMAAIFREVHASQMSKDFHHYKMVKGPGYKEANITQFFSE